MTYLENYNRVDSLFAFFVNNSFPFITLHIMSKFCIYILSTLIPPIKRIPSRFSYQRGLYPVKNKFRRSAIILWLDLIFAVLCKNIEADFRVGH